MLADNVNVAKVFYSRLMKVERIEYGSPVNLSGLKEGQHTITYFASDDVDNVEEKKTYSFFVDTSAPRVIDEIIGNTFIVNGKGVLLRKNQAQSSWLWIISLE